MCHCNTLKVLIGMCDIAVSTMYKLFLLLGTFGGMDTSSRHGMSEQGWWWDFDMADIQYPLILDNVHHSLLLQALGINTAANIF